MRQTCGSIREWLGAYADKELDPAQVAKVEQHLETCAGCRRELDQIQELHRLAKSVEHPRLAEDYWDWHRTKVWRGIRNRKRAPAPLYRPLFVWPKLAAVAAGFVVVLVVVIAGWRTLLPRQGLMRSVGELTSEPRRAAEQPVATAPGVRRSAESEETEKAAGGISAKVEGRSDELAQVPATTARDAERAKVGYAAKGAGATGAASASKPSPVSLRKAVSELEIATREPSEGLPAAPSSDQLHVSASLKKESRIVSGPVLLESPPLPDADALDTGTVLLSVKTDTGGRVLSAAVRRSSGSAQLDSVAVSQMRRSRFQAAVKKNRNVPSSFVYPFRFQKRQAEPQEQKKQQEVQKPKEEEKKQKQEEKTDKQDGQKQDRPPKEKTKK